MHVTTETVTTYTVEITQYQAQDLLTIAHKIANQPGPGIILDLDPDEKETLSTLRQELLTVGIIAKKEPG